MIPNLLDERAYVNRADERIDPHNPFQNPTEEHDYTPDYTEIVPQIAIEGCRIPLIPSPKEKAKIRSAYTLAGVPGAMDFVLAAIFSALLYFAAASALRHFDLQILDGALPQNYKSIMRAYLGDSSISMGITLLSFLTANIITFFVGSRISHIRVKDYFQDKDLRTGSLLRYIAIGLWLQLLLGFAAQLLSKFFANSGFTLSSPDFSAGDSTTKLLLTVLYSCFVAPLTEELVFRGVILKNFSRVSQRLGIFLSAFFFALAHENLPQGILAFCLGIFLAYITISHNSLVPAMVVHFCVNLVNAVFSYLDVIAPNAVGNINSIYMLCVLLFGTAAFFYTLLTERLPFSTPHQSFRGLRLALSSAGVWLLILVHLVSMTLPKVSTVLSRLFLKG
ncbi:MAG: CPBP family intramembrane metalloprotease [Oscillospiraceae bacterium]|nr:CPBP family intramembrane metalloprotease [Oscillospiraceae bacterium]